MATKLSKHSKTGWKAGWKKISTDPSFWLLLAVNCWLVYCYEQRPQIFSTLIWLYWSQSVLFGIFTYLDIRTSKLRYDSGYAALGDTKLTLTESIQANIWFFTYIYSFFHIVYTIFLAGFLHKTGPFEWDFFWKFLALFFVSQLITFVQHKIQNKHKAVDITTMTTLPFIRIIPMHLCILIPAFLNISNLTIFLILKVICDMVMYVHTASHLRNSDPLLTTTEMNIDSTA